MHNTDKGVQAVLVFVIDSLREGRMMGEIRRSIAPEEDTPRCALAKKRKRVRNSSYNSVADLPLVPNRVMRTKSLLLAALRVWELKQRIAD